MNTNCSIGLANTCNITQATNDLEILVNVKKVTRALISAETKRMLEIYLNILTFMVTSLFGVVANVINITVYWRQGLKDSITLGFFALSLSDLIMVTMPLMTASCYAARLLLPNTNINFPSLHYVSAVWLRNMFYSISSCFTAFLSIERCCCVVLPFKVHMIFSRKRTVLTISAIFLLHVFCFLPIFATHRLQWHASITNNSTLKYIFRVNFLPNREVIEEMNYNLFSIIVPTVSQLIVTVCVTILINGLRKSSRFRKALTSRNYNSQTDHVEEITESGVKNETTGNRSAKMDTDDCGDLSSREARLVKTMIFLVIILTSANVPFLMLNYALRFIPELNVRGAYHNTSSVSHAVVYILGTLNATVNVFVYYKTSTKFRDIAKELFTCKAKA